MPTLVFILLLMTCSDIHAAEYAVVVSKNSPMDQLDVKKVRDIFLKKRNFDGTTRLVPVNLLGEEPVRREFEIRVLGMEREEINRFWITNHFQGISPPTTQASSQSIKRFVERVDGAIGYLPAGMVDAELKVVHEF